MSANVPTSNKKMKKGGLFILLVMFLFSCSEKEPLNIFTIEGNTGVPHGIVYLLGTDSRYDKTDSVACDTTGYFSISIPADTMLPLALITPDKRFVPVYCEPRITARLQQDSTLFSGWRVEGGKLQALHDSISRVLDGCSDAKERYEVIDSFILKYPINEVNIEIIRRYMTEQPEIDHKTVRSRTGNIGGVLMDHGFFTRLKERTDSKVSNVMHRSFPTFSYTLNDSTTVTQSDYMRKYTLVTIWASWDKNSVEKVKMLAGVKDSVKSKSFAILNISLDHDSVAWRKTVTEDSIAGDNVIDNKMFQSPLVEQFGIKSLPFTMLVSPYQRVQRYNVEINGIAADIDSLTKRYDKEQKERKRREEEKKKREKKKEKEKGKKDITVKKK